MAKKQIKNYVFVPGPAGVGKVKFLDKIDQSSVLLITNTTNNVNLYNFSDPAKQITLTFQRVGDGVDSDFPYATSTSEGITHIFFQTDTSGMSATDELQIFVEAEEVFFRPFRFGTDAIERMRVATPQSMIDADFEYGLQPTKWQTIDIARGYPSIYEIPGSETDLATITTDASSGTGGVGDSLITVYTVSTHGLEINDPIRISGVDDSVVGGARANGSFVVSSIPTADSFTYYAKGKVGTSSGTSLKTSYTALKKGDYYTGADIGTPTFTVESQGSSGTVVTEYQVPSGSNRIAYDDAQSDDVVIGSPLTGTGMPSGVQVTGIATLPLNTVKTVYDDVTAPQNTVTLQDASSLQVGCAVSNGAASNAESIFITNITNNVVTLSGQLQTSYNGSNTQLGIFTGGTYTKLFGNGTEALFDVSRDEGRYRIALGNYTSTGTGSGGTTTITGINTAGVVLGQSVSGTGIASGAEVASIGAGEVGVTISHTGAVSGTITFTNIGSGYAVGDRIRLFHTGIGANLVQTQPIVKVTGVNGSGGITSFTSAKEPSSQASSSKLTTSVAYEGGSSLLLNGTDSQVTFDSDEEFNFGSDPFTVDFQLYRNRTGVTETLWDMRTGSTTDGALSVFVDTNDMVNLRHSNGTVISGITTTVSSQWTHIAVSKSGTTTKLFVGGVEQGSYTDNNSYGARPIRLGSTFNGADYTGANYDLFRVSKGIARYTSAFDSPGVVYNDVYNSLLLRFRGINNSLVFIDDSKGTARLSSASYSSLQGNSSAAGVGAKFTIQRSGGATSTYVVTLVSPGAGYVQNETITIDGSLLGGASSTNDVTITVNTVDAQGGVLTSSAAGTAASGNAFVQSLGQHNGSTNSGSGASLTVARNGASYAASVSGGVGYYPEYQIRVVGSDLGGDATNNLTVTTNNIGVGVTFGIVDGNATTGTPVAADSISFFPGITLSDPTDAIVPNNTSLSFSSIASIGCTFASNHGLVPGSPVFVNIGSTGSNHDLVGGPRIIEGIPELNKIVFNARTAGTVGAGITGEVYTRPDCFYIHRPFDGGVLLGTGSPTHGAQAIRQSKKYLRYQSGKGIMFTTGTLLAPSYDVRQLTANGTAVGSIITITTDDIEHGLQANAEIVIKGITTPGYNGAYSISEVIDEFTFTVLANQTLGSTNAVLGDQPQVSLSKFKGSTVRAGAFDEQNGIFWQYDGVNLSVGLRSSTYQLAGTIAINSDSNTVTGTNTRFREQLIAGNKIVIRGMTHTVTHVASNTELTVTPDFRGINNVSGVKGTLVKEILIPQSQWNIDRGDGTGPSGYKIEVNKMQMYGFQYSWYGAGFIDWMLRGPNGDYLYCHRLKNNNRNTEAFMRSGNLPVRYEVINEGAKTKLTEAVGAGSTTHLSIDNVTLLPPSGSLYIDNEIINYTGITTASNTLTGITREGTYSNFYSGSTRTYSAGIATAHDAGTGIVLLSNTATPIISHWGSAYLTDGLFDSDRGYIFNYQATGFDISTVKQTAFLIRLSPSVSNAILGDLGERELINRAQLLLKGLEFTATGGSSTQGVVIEGVLNPQNYPKNVDDIEWFALNNVAVGGQPSFAQIADGTQVTWPGSVTTYVYTNSLNRNFKSQWIPLLASDAANLRVGMQVTAAGLAGGTTIRRIESYTFQSGGQTHKWIQITNRINAGNAGNTSFTFTTVDNRAIPGETIFSFVGSGGGGNATSLDLSDLKELNNTPIGGRGAFPNGPDVLAINVYTTSGSDFTGNLVLRWSEAQA